MPAFTIPVGLMDLNTYIERERSHRMAGAKIKKEQTEIAQWCAKSLKPMKSPVYITYRWYCRDKKKDKDNIAFARKFIQDGLVKAGVLKNDGWNDIEGFEDKFYIDSQNPRIEVEVVEIGG